MVADWWTQSFPRCHFSFNRSVSQFNEGQLAALRGMEEARLLLETDAPYFHRRGQAYSAPSELYDTTELVARHRNVSTERILSVTKNNVVMLYGGRQWRGWIERDEQVAGLRGSEWTGRLLVWTGWQGPSDTNGWAPLGYVKVLLVFGQVDQCQYHSFSGSHS